MDDKGPDRFFFFYTFAIVDQPFWKYSDVQLDWKSTRDDSLNNFFLLYIWHCGSAILAVSDVQLD